MSVVLVLALVLALYMMYIDVRWIYILGSADWVVANSLFPPSLGPILPTTENFDAVRV